MKTSAVITVIGLCASTVAAVDLKHYQAGTGVEAEFADFLKEYVRAALTMYNGSISDILASQQTLRAI